MGHNLQKDECTDDKKGNIDFGGIKFDACRMWSGWEGFLRKGTDKEYFVFTVEHVHPYIDGGTNPIIVNEDGQYIYELILPDNQALFINDKTKNALYNGEHYYLEEDKLYYIEFDSWDTSTDLINIQENVLTITQDGLKTVKTKIYKGQGSGQLS